MNAARSYWPIGHDDLESYYYKFEKACGTWGNTGKRQEKKIDRGNSFEAPRSSEFPLTPSHNMVLFETAVCNLGYRQFSVPGSHFTVIPRAFMNPNFEARTKSYAMKGRVRPLAAIPCHPGSPRWGEGWKKAVVETYQQVGISRDRRRGRSRELIACLQQQAGQ